ncbi:hypothetical protein EKO24_016250 [Candidatus Methylobacter oryzae]|uniref:Fibronectin type-III domain-containing protein n=2 Tax=Candidatus Methylobacter oryzae TaxID=2497749 RepID=A0ABY3C737_9GAMM|nr:hypothetical protein EKO24_016250 [Candidatus Methylobacter oryzae]
MKDSTKLLFSPSLLNHSSAVALNLPQECTADMDNLNLGLQPLNIQDDQEEVRSAQKAFYRKNFLTFTSTAEHRRTQQAAKSSKQTNSKKNIVPKLIFIGCIQGLFGLQQAYATTYYVSTSGSDNNTGTDLSTPVRTINKALSKAWSSGDIVYVMTGTYSEALSINQNSITLSAYPNNNPVIDGGTSLPNSDWGALIEVSGNYNKISGFEIKNSNINGARAGGRGIHLSGHHNTVSKMNVHHSWDVGILAEGDYSIVEDSKIWQSARSNSSSPGQGGWSTGLSAARNRTSAAIKPGINSYSTLRRNTVYNNWGEGLSCYEADHCTLEDNVVFDNWTNNLYVSDTTNSLVQRNMVYISSNPAIPSRNNVHTGITLADELSNIPRSTNNTIINNFVYNADFSAFSWTLVANSGLKNVTIANNTIVDGGLLTGSGGNVVNSSSQIRNNIIIGNHSSIPSNSGISFSNNNWTVTPPSAAASSSNVIADPQIARSGTTTSGTMTPAYFKISGSSPVINTAMALNNVSNDFFQVSRGSSPDIGGHEYQSSSTPTPAPTPTPTSDTTAPSAPANLGASASSATQVNLTWNASTDNVGVSGYKIYRNGTEIGNKAATGYSDTSAVAGTSYSYTVKAYDAAGNLSAASNTATVTTPAASSSLNVSSYYVDNITSYSATVHWTTNATSTAMIYYGTSPSNLNLSAGSNQYNGTSRYWTLWYLNRNTTYYYKIVATSGSATASSPVASFKTAN